jgi:AcrR family transcriptional regulator
MKRKTAQEALHAKSNPDSYHHGSLKKTLIQTAIRFLEKHPLESLSLRTLALKAGVSQAAPYRHFKDRDELLAAISQQGFEIKFQYMWEAFLTYRDQPKELLQACALSYFKMGLKHPQHFKLMLASPICPSPEHPMLEQAAGMAFALLKRVIEICQSAGIVGPGDPYHKSMHCWALVNGFTTLYAEGRLQWLGIDEKNAESALRVFVDQYLIGNRNPLPNPGAMSLFQTEDSKDSMHKLKAAGLALDKMISEHSAKDPANPISQKSSPSTRHDSF